MFVTTFASNAPSPLYVIYQQRFGFSATTVTLVFACYAVVVLITLLVVGHVSDRVGRKKLMAPSLVVLALSSGVFAMAQGVAWLFVARALQGVATGGLTAAATASLVELVGAGDKRRASYINTVAFVAGATGGPLTSGLLAQYAPYPLRTPFAVELAMIIICLLLMAGVPETVVSVQSLRWRLQVPGLPREVRRAFVASALAVSVSWGAGALYGALSPTIDARLLGIQSHAAAGAELAALFGVGGVSQVLTRQWPTIKATSVGVVALAVGMVLVVWAVSERLLGLFIPATLLVGAGSGMAFMGSMALVNATAPPDKRAQVLAAYNIVGYLALSLPIVGVGLVIGVLGLQGATQVFGIAVVACCALSLQSLAKLRGSSPGSLPRLEIDVDTEINSH
jgi:MFS family permease